MSETARTAATFWDASPEERGPIYWAAHDRVREYVNTAITGVPWLFPLPAFKVGWTYRPLRRGLSIGCGTGALERAVRFLRICDEVDAYDVSEHSIAEAKKLAAREGVDRVHYRVADCDAKDFGESRYDVAFFHGSLHHISDPDTVLERVARSLKPHGLLFVDDYVGPSRDQWLDDAIRERWLRDARVESEKVDPSLYLHPLAAPLEYSDPSEMIRSDRILPAISANFDVLQNKPYWGNLLFPLLCHIDGYAVQRAEHSHLLDRWIAREKVLAESGAFEGPLFAVVVARKKGWRDAST